MEEFKTRANEGRLGNLAHLQIWVSLGADRLAPNLADPAFNYVSNSTVNNPWYGTLIVLFSKYLFNVH